MPQATSERRDTSIASIDPIWGTSRTIVAVIPASLLAPSTFAARRSRLEVVVREDIQRRMLCFTLFWHALAVIGGHGPPLLLLIHGHYARSTTIFSPETPCF